MPTSIRRRTGKKLQAQKKSLESAAKKANSIHHTNDVIKNWEAWNGYEIDRGEIWWINLDPTVGRGRRHSSAIWKP